jgi:ketosteroid isomerase-like protein
VTAQRSNEEVVREYAAAAAANDLEALARLRDADWTVEWPQSGERVRGSDRFAAVVEHYPGGTPRATVTRVVGGEDRWILSPSNTVMRVSGGGDHWWAEWLMAYPDGVTYNCIDLIELRDGRVYRESVYWARPFEAPPWRAPWVERVGEPT